MQSQRMNNVSGSLSHPSVSCVTIIKMEFSQATDEDQARILRTYTALHQLHPVWPGALILFLGLDPAGSALSVASNIAGAVSLALDNNPHHLRAATRAGSVDFTVTTLDEAIRAMKNEVRKQTPLSVALNADPLSTLDDILDRGLAPQLFSTFLPQYTRISQAAATFRSFGASLIDFSEATFSLPGFRPSSSIIGPLLQARGWTLHTFSFDSTAALRSFDSRALETLPPASASDQPDTLRRRWLESAPRILRRQQPPHRTLWLTRPEADSLRGSFPQENAVKP